MQTWLSAGVGALSGIIFATLVTTLNFKSRLVKSEETIKHHEKNWDRLQPTLEAINKKLEKISVDVAVLKSKGYNDAKQ